MPSTPNKIKYGLCNCYYAIATIDAETGEATYDTPVALPGAVNLSMEPQGENTPFYADNIVYWITSANQGYEGDLEIALIPESFKTDILGYLTDGKGVLFENAEANAVHFGFMFQFEGDQKATRHILYNCTVTRPTQAGSTKTDSTEPQTETLTLTATTVKNAILNKNVVKAESVIDTDSTVYEGWFSAVYQGTAVTT